MREQGEQLALPVPGRTGTRISASSSPGLITVSYGPRWNSLTGTIRSPSWPRMTAVARTAANTALDCLDVQVKTTRLSSHGWTASTRQG